MSTEEQEDSPMTQGHLTLDFLQQNDAPPWTRTYFDLGKSGGSLEGRPSMLTMLAEAERLRPACIVFYRLDRAFRNAEEQAVALNRLKRWGIGVLKVRDPNLQGPIGELVDGILGNINQFERQLTGMRIRDHNLAMAQRGEWPGGTPPFGYRYRQATRETRGRKRVTTIPGGLEPDEQEWPMARQIWDWALAGYRKVEIVDLANATGYRRRNGLPWSTEAITLMLISKTYAGYVPFARHLRMHGQMKRQWDRAEWYAGNHQALITLDEWERVQATTNARLGQRKAHSRPRSELAGLIRCRLCGGIVGANSYTRDGGYHYTCLSATKHAVTHPFWSRRDWVVHMAIQRILDEVVTVLPPPPPEALSAAQDAALRAELQRLKEQHKRLRTLYELGEFADDLAEYQRRRGTLAEQVAVREAELTTAGRTVGDLAQRWETLRSWEAAYLGAGSVREKQRIWGAMIEEVHISATSLSVRLKDFGLAVPRDWALDLPAVRTRRPGSRCGRGIVGERKTAKPQ